MINGAQVIMRSAEGVVITSHMLTNTHSRSLLDEVSNYRCLRGQEDRAKQEITGTPFPLGRGFRAGAGVPLLPLRAV